jgi:hypothetical protein
LAKPLPILAALSKSLRAASFCPSFMKSRPLWLRAWHALRPVPLLRFTALFRSTRAAVNHLLHLDTFVLRCSWESTSAAAIIIYCTLMYCKKYQGSDSVSRSDTSQITIFVISGIIYLYIWASGILRVKTPSFSFVYTRLPIHWLLYVWVFPVYTKSRVWTNKNIRVLTLTRKIPLAHIDMTLYSHKKCDLTSVRSIQNRSPRNSCFAI